MLITNNFTVIGVMTIDEDVLFCKTLSFVGINPKLVIVPARNATPGSQRILKIVAQTIDTSLCSNAKITYNLDGDITNTTPVGPSGLDPDTKPAKAANGFSYIQDPIDLRCFIDPSSILNPQDLQNRIKPECEWGKRSYNISLDPASNYPNPNILSLDPSGEYPRAADGGKGLPGGSGANGVKGQDAPILEIWVEKITGSGLLIDLRGQPGGNGGDGGTGQHGGNGQKGSTATVVPDKLDTWVGEYEMPLGRCEQRPGRGGDAGKGGDAGAPGRGGDGGNGGIIKVFYTQTAAPGLPTWTVQKQGGAYGIPGQPGLPGIGGKGGPQGDNQILPGVNSSPCTPGENGKDGDPGDPYQFGEDKGQGKEGTEGVYITQLVSAIPKVKFPLFG